MSIAQEPIRLAIITGSTRPGRKSLSVAQWVQEVAVARSDLTVEIVDVAQQPLPHLDESVPPIVGEYENEHTRTWATRIDAFDGFVFVTPEYNHSIPGVLKNAVDFLYAEWNDKVAGFVTYGADGGVRAAEHLRVILGELRVADVRQQVGLALDLDFRGYESFAPRVEHGQTLEGMFDELVSWGRALRDLRRRRHGTPATLDAIVIRTRVKPEERNAYRAQLDEMYAELTTVGAPGFHSLTFQLGDGEYLDVAVGAELPGPVGELSSFKEFRTGLENRCEHRSAQPAALVHAYGL